MAQLQLLAVSFQLLSAIFAVKALTRFSREAACPEAEAPLTEFPHNARVLCD